MPYNPAKSKEEQKCVGCGMATHSLDRFDGRKPKCYGCYAGPWVRPEGYEAKIICSGANFSKPASTQPKRAPFYSQDREVILADVLRWDAQRRKLGYDPSDENQKQNMQSRMRFLGVKFPKYQPTKFTGRGRR